MKIFLLILSLFIAACAGGGSSGSSSGAGSGSSDSGENDWGFELISSKSPTARPKLHSRLSSVLSFTTIDKRAPEKVIANDIILSDRSDIQTNTLYYDILRGNGFPELIKYAEDNNFKEMSILRRAGKVWTDIQKRTELALDWLDIPTEHWDKLKVAHSKFIKETATILDDMKKALREARAKLLLSREQETSMRDTMTKLVAAVNAGNKSERNILAKAIQEAFNGLTDRPLDEGFNQIKEFFAKNLDYEKHLKLFEDVVEKHTPKPLEIVY